MLCEKYLYLLTGLTVLSVKMLFFDTGCMRNLYLFLFVVYNVFVCMYECILRNSN